MKKEYSFLVLKALNFFVENPYEEIHLREFSRKLKISLNSAQRFLNLFLNENLIKDERKANLRYFKANLDSIVFRNIKLIFSLKKVEDSGIIKALEKKVSYVVIFGSIAEGLDDEKSDIDLLVIGKDKKKIREIIFQYQKKFDRELNSHIFSWFEWKKQAKINKAFYQEVITKGVCLVGEKPIVE
ncbi:nucleotidyltransferase domain-containing protein [Candidatus Pacearchaeota archaeon]|nr:nucleotidyltransferase domain-containing protein [Candidatus Pacearchaeota archaeon]